MLLLFVLTCGWAVAQYFPGERQGSLVRIEGGQVVDEDLLQTARETDSHSMNTPVWTNAPGFGMDVFTFARVIFQSEPSFGRGGRGGFGRRLGWWVDYPDADLNLSWRLQSLTAIRTDPDARVLKLTNPDLFNYPFLFMEHTGHMLLSEEEVKILRRYLRNGGSILVTDFWGEEEWIGFEYQMSRVMPDKKWTELKNDHPIFHCVYPIEGPIRSLQIPTMQFWNPYHDPNDPRSGPLQRRDRGIGHEEMHARAWHDDNGRMNVLAIFNCDLSDGWEREGEDNQYFQTYSEKIAYPLGINIIVYFMTH